MARKNSEPIPGQFSLMDSIEEPENKGVAVNIADRAPHLIEALGAISSINSAGGLGFIHDAKHPARKELYGRYQDITPIVVDGAQAKIPEHRKKIRESMWKAGAYDQTIAAGLMTKEKAEAFHRQDMSELRRKYGGTGKVSDKRNRFKKKLQKDIKFVEKTSQTRTT